MEILGILYLCLTFSVVYCGIPETTFTHMDIYKTLMSWNDAQRKCADSGGNLLKVNSKVKHLALESLLSQMELLKTPRLEDFWIGLHNTDDIFRWSDCSNLTSWETWNGTRTDSINDLFCAVSDNDLKWTMVNCSGQCPFVCETQTPCGCSVVLDTVCVNLLVSSSVTVMGVSLEDCQSRCMNHVGANGKDECWGLTYGLGTCHLHEKMVTTPVCMPDHKVYTKQCFSYSYHAVTSLPIPSSSSMLPGINCSTPDTTSPSSTTETTCMFNFETSTIQTTDPIASAVIISTTESSLSSPQTAAQTTINPVPSNCVCYVPKNVTVEERIEQIISELKVDVRNTTLSRMKKLSAKDDRTSAKTLGVAGIVVLVMTFGGVVVLDLSKLLNDAYHGCSKMKTSP